MGPKLRRYTPWGGLAAALVPLVLLLVLQYRWLVELDHSSAIATQATLDNYVETVAEKVEHFYRGAAERALNLPADLFAAGRLDQAAYHFKKKEIEGARRLFVVDLVHDEYGKPLYYDPATASLVEPEWSPEVRAVYAATAPFRILASKGGKIEPVTLAVDERDPEVRMVLNPITDDWSRPVGVAGMILDARYFRDELLPLAAAKALPKFFWDRRQEPIVWVMDGRGGTVFATSRPDRSPESSKAFTFAFRDFRLNIASCHATAGEVARRNFLLNLALSAALATALLGGVVLALRTAARAMKLSEMKSDFVSNVSHELRTPLASIRVFGELLRLGRFDGLEKAREYGEYIETESRRLTQLVNNLLDFASIESGRKSYRFERADLEELVAETLKTFGVRLRQNGFQIVFQGPAEPLPPLRLDPAAVAQSLSNLLDNAVKYSNGGRQIEVFLRREGAWAVVAVRDQGIGIPRDEQEKIFDRFHRVGTRLVHDVKGSGLGLAIVRHIAEAHGGRVAVESRVGEGSTFSFYLPLDGAGEPAVGRLDRGTGTPFPSKA